MALVVCAFLAAFEPWLRVRPPEDCLFFFWIMSTHDFDVGSAYLIKRRLAVFCLVYARNFR